MTAKRSLLLPGTEEEKSLSTYKIKKKYHGHKEIVTLSARPESICQSDGSLMVSCFKAVEL